MNKTQNDLMAKALMPYLKQKAMADAELLEALEKENKSIEECVEYIVFKATHGEDKSVIMAGEEVLDMASEYYKNDAIVMPKMSSDKKVEQPKPKVEQPKAAPSKPKKKKEEPLILDLFAEM